MRYNIQTDGTLAIHATDADMEFIRDIASQCENFDSNATMCDVFEDLIANSELDWIAPEEIGALTDAPILGTRDEDGIPREAWGFMDYQVRSPQEDLISKGCVIFTR